MVRFIKQFWRALVALATWIGLIFLAKDVYELPEALKAWGPLMPDRETALAIFSGILAIWIAWSDVRPFMQKILAARERTPIIVDPIVRIESFRMKKSTKDDQIELWLNVYYVIVSNGDPLRTLHNVSADLHTWESPSRCPIKGSNAFATDIRHRELVSFRLGHIVSTDTLGLPMFSNDGPVDMSDEISKSYLHNLQLGSFAFEPSQKQARFNLRDDPSYHPYQFSLVLTGNDLSARTVAVKIAMEAARPTVTLVV